jgi:hypothetical protein
MTDPTPVPTDPRALAAEVAKLARIYVEHHPSNPDATAAGVHAAGRLMTIGDALVRRHVPGCDTLGELLGEYEEHGYRPTCRADLHPELGILADVYDFVAAARDQSCRAYRG